MASAAAAARAADLLEAMFRRLPERPFAVRLWDGSTWPDEAGKEPRFTVTVHEPAALRQMVLARDEASLGAAYMTGEIDLAGDLEAVSAVADALVTTMPPWRERLRMLTAALRLPRAAPDGRGAPVVAARGGAAAGAAPPGEPAAGPAARSAAGPTLRGRAHSRARDRAAVTYHYDASNDFYRLFLDPRLVYSCAYFAERDEPLEAAQERKLDYVCRKLRLRPGQRLLDIGCGWGALIVHAASRYGVVADGITLSENQAEVARERIRAAELEGRCSVRVADYRELDAPAAYDRVASIGMFEHVGEARMEEYYRLAHRLLRAGGAFLNHAIAGVQSQPRAGQSFTDRWVFPDSQLLPISVALRGAEAVGFEVRDVEDLREHYALTLRHWVRRLEERREQAVAAAGEPVWRAWRLVFAASAHRFDTAQLHVYQALLVKPDERGRARLPLTRADWYAGE